MNNNKFLNEKTYSSEKTKIGRNKWWYTHKNLRGVRSHINNALPYMFIYVRYPNIPKTTNFLEGGINRKIKNHFLNINEFPWNKKLH